MLWIAGNHIDLSNVVLTWFLLENVVSIHFRMLSRRSIVEGIICSCLVAEVRRNGLSTGCASELRTVWL